MPTLREQLQQLLVDRHSPEARALFLTIIKYVEGRVRAVARYTCSDVLSESELEEVVADVLLQLMSGSLAQFRGNTLPELLAFVRTVSDRRLWRFARRRIRERDSAEASEAEAPPWSVGRAQSPEEAVEFVSTMTLPSQDEQYLKDLLRAGSKAEYARQNALSRAAVTQRVQRIRNRIDALGNHDRTAVDAWLQQMARDVLREG